MAAENGDDYAEEDTGHLGEYDHLNKGGLNLKLDVDTLADIIVRENYGFVRMITALCRANRKRLVNSHQHALPLTDLIEQAIRRGLWT